jgi:hypothetical protein
MENWNSGSSDEAPPKKKSPAGRRGPSRCSILDSRFYIGVRFFEKQSLQ